MATEEERAVEYRRMMLAREANAKANERTLAGSAAARRALGDAWEPVVLALRERVEGETC